MSIFGPSKAELDNNFAMAGLATGGVVLSAVILAATKPIFGLFTRSPAEVAKREAQKNAQVVMANLLTAEDAAYAYVMADNDEDRAAAMETTTHTGAVHKKLIRRAVILDATQDPALVLTTTHRDSLAAGRAEGFKALEAHKSDLTEKAKALQVKLEAISARISAVEAVAA